MSNGGNHYEENADMSASAAGHMDAPPSVESSNSGSGFDLPPVGAEGESGNEGGSNVESTATAQLLDLKSRIEQKLIEAAGSNAMSLASMRNIDSAGIQGVGISAGALPDEPSRLVVYVECDANEEQVRREMVDIMGIQAASSDAVAVEVEVTGRVEAYTSNRSKFRPAPAGVSVGHFQITAGTIGGWARGRSADRRNRLLMLSNNHVLANSNRGRFGDSIIQPGAADGGVNPADRIAILERFVPINFTAGAINFVDCATGWCWPNLVRRDHVYHGGSATAKFFRVGNSIAAPKVDMVVGKTGRTTDLTRGTIRATGVTVNVSFGSAGVATFRDQFSVQSTTSSPFSAGGDSGSLVWQWAAGLHLVGLLFAGGGGTTFCNRIDRVFTALDINPFELPLA